MRVHMCEVGEWVSALSQVTDTRTKVRYELLPWNTARIHHDGHCGETMLIAQTHIQVCGEVANKWA
jgi:hypothetical protein